MHSRRCRRLVVAAVAATLGAVVAGGPLFGTQGTGGGKLNANSGQGRPQVATYPFEIWG